MSVLNLMSMDVVFFLACLYKSIGCYSFQPDVGIAAWVWASHFKFFTSKFFYEMGKALLGELSCMRTSLVVPLT